MVDKVTLTPVSTFVNDTTAVSAFNNNMAAITTAIDNTLSLTPVPSTNNSMNGNLDMNSNQILNLPSPASMNSPARLVDVASNPTITVPPIGTSGGTVPLLNTNNTWSGTNTFNGLVTLTSLTGVNIPVASGGTGATTAPAARVNLNIDQITTHGDSAYNILNTDRTVVTSAALTAPRTWVLPLASTLNPGQELTIGDIAFGVTSTNTLTITRNTADTIVGLIEGNAQTSFVFTHPGETVRLVCDGVSKWIIASRTRNFLQADATNLVTAGFTFTPFSYGSVTTGTITPNPSSCLKQSLINNGSFTLAATAQVGDVELLVNNGASAGTITFSGFTKQFGGDALDTTNGHNFVIFIYAFGSGAAYLIKALQ